MANGERFIERRKKPWGRSGAELIIAVSAVTGLLISVFTGVRAFYVNEYRIDQMEGSIREVRIDIKQARTDIQDMDRSVQRLVGAATRQNLSDDRPKHGN
jgi:hypothetical protein